MEGTLRLRNPVWTKESVKKIISDLEKEPVHTIIFDQNFDIQDSVYVDMSKFTSEEDEHFYYKPIFKYFAEKIDEYNEWDTKPENRVKHIKFINQTSLDDLQEGDTYNKLKMFEKFISISYLKSISFGKLLFPNRPFFSFDLDYLQLLIRTCNDEIIRNSRDDDNKLESLFIFGDTFENERRIYQRLREIQNPTNSFWNDTDAEEKIHFLEVVRIIGLAIDDISKKLFDNGKISAEKATKDMQYWNSMPQEFRTTKTPFLPQDIQHIVSSYMAPRKL